MFAKKGLKLALLLIACSGLARGERIVLKNGTELFAPGDGAIVLKRTPEALFLDLGFDLLRIPAGEILSVRTNSPIISAALSSTDRLYVEREMPRLTTGEAANRFAPAVVVVKTAAGLGSGFFINKKGYLLTNFHVIAGEKKIAVTQFIKEGPILRRVVHKDVEIVAVAPFHDLALLRVKEADPDTLVSVVFAPKEELSIGETVFAIGNPVGLERSVTEGVLSKTDRNFRGILYLQVDAPINPGNSGGPLFNARGQVVGIVNMGVPTMEGLNFAIPAWHAKYVLDHVEAYAYDPANSESGFVYPDPPRRPGSFSSPQQQQEETP